MLNPAMSIQYKIVERVEEVDEIVTLQEEIWGRNTATPLPQLLASIHHGGVIIGAFEQRQFIGFCFGFPGFKNGENYLVSHMAGILPTHQNSGIGFQLKLRQREWAMDYGYRKIIWTFDPLEARNGYFNLCKLGAYSKTYVPAYYGELKDNLNQGLPADRLVMEWDIGSKRVERALSGSSRFRDPEDDYELWSSELETGSKGWPEGCLVPVPANIQALKKDSPDKAMTWRMEMRHALSAVLSNGYILTGVRKRPDSEVYHYVLERDAEDLDD